VLRYKDPLTGTWLPLSSAGPPGPAGADGPPGADGAPGEPTTLYIQPDTPDVSVHPDGYPLWMDTDEEPPAGGGGGATSLDQLTDVDTGTVPPVGGQALVFNGTLWVPGTVAGGGGGLDQATADGLYVNVAGDTMAGTLNVDGGFNLNAAAGVGRSMTFQTDWATQWAIGKNAIDDLSIGRYNAGSWAADALTINKTTGAITVEADPTVPLGVATKQYTDSRIWKGTQAEYDAIPAKDPAVLYVVTG